MKKIAFLILCCSTSISAQLYFPPSNPSAFWDTLSAQDLNWCPQKIARLDSFARAANSKSLLILKDGKIAHEAYYGSFTQDSLWYWASAAKTLTAFLVGMAQEDGFLDINDASSDYLGQGWTSLTPAREMLIKVRDQLQMTTGLDYQVPDLDCTVDTCLQYRMDAGTQWYYHNAPYLLLHGLIDSATGLNINQYTGLKLFGTIGFRGFWFDDLMVSNARTMARFGLLMLAQGQWNGQTILGDLTYLQAMTNSSQNLNPAYGYLTWLNGKSSYIQPGLPIAFSGPIIPSAPGDLYMAAGKNDQRIYVLPSQNLVVVRQGLPADSVALALSGFDDQLWQYLNDLECGLSMCEEVLEPPHGYPNPVQSLLFIEGGQKPQNLQNAQGQNFPIVFENGALLMSHLPKGIYFLGFENGAIQRVLKQEN